MNGDQVDEIARIIMAPRMSTNMSGDRQRAIAADILAAGYRKPRAVDGSYALDELPAGAVIKGEFLVWEKNAAGTWLTPGVDVKHHKASSAVVLAEGDPVFTVLYEPEVA